MVRQNNKSIITLLRCYSKVITAFLGVNFLSSLVYPMASYALTSGPTTPEVTSFEPVDTTDMVNLLTGDMAYNIPLLEVPGPGGGFPVGMSYHAGIMPNEEASWTGLGWTLNPGAITRDVRGYVDDQKDAEQSERIFWEGGERHIVDIGHTIGIAGVMGPSAGISVGYDTYQGLGAGASAGISIGLGSVDNPAGLGLSVGSSPWGGPYISTGLSLPGAESSVSPRIGLSSNFSSVSGSLGVSNFGSATISSNGVSTSLAIGGASATSTHNLSSKVSSFGSGFSIPLGIVSLGYRYQRYWVDEIENIKVNGSLNFAKNSSDLTEASLDEEDYDVYSIHEIGSSLTHPDDPIEQLGGSFPNIDNYRVNAQGVSGNIAPHFYQSHLQRRNRFKSDDGTKNREVTHYPLGFTDESIGFRFLNDFSNSYTYDPANFVSDNANPLDFSFDWSNPVHGESGNDGFGDNQLIGSKNIRTLTNSQISNYNPNLYSGLGFIDCNATGFTRFENSSSIGAFVITNESGVKYHFSLPAYIYNEYRFSGNVNVPSGDSYNESRVLDPYAYTWHLTAITGPDFVDRGTIGSLDEEDWGYWVEFEYGKWTSAYHWRTPSQGLDKDIDNNFSYYSSGDKEIYYLDAIRTKTHTALFVKDIRNDAKSVAASVLSDRYLDLGFIPKNYDAEVIRRETVNNGDFPCKDGYKEIIDDASGMAYPVSSLKLSKVMLLRNDQLEAYYNSSTPTIKNTSDELDFSTDFESGIRWITYKYNPPLCEKVVVEDVYFPTVPLNATSLTSKLHEGDNVLDVYDTDISQLEQLALRQVVFETDYSLSPETPNSFDHDNLYTTVPSQNEEDYDLTGKLTLNKLHFLGRGENTNNAVLPPIDFVYGEESYLNPTADITRLSGDNNYQLSFDSNVTLSEGEIVRTEDNVPVSQGGQNQQHSPQFFFITNVNSGVSYDAIHVGPENPIGDVGLIIDDVQLTKTKNPPFKKDAHDLWGMYKPDVDPELCEISDNIGRRVTDLSAKSVDVWSLSKIITQTGANIEIDYESDDYSKVALAPAISLAADSFVKYDADELEITVNDVDLESLFSGYTSIDVAHAFRITLEPIYRGTGSSDDCDLVGIQHVADSERATWEITNMNGSTLRIRNATAMAGMYYVDQSTGFSGEDCEIMASADGPDAMNIFLPVSTGEIKGGGIRVKDLAVSDIYSDTKTITTYTYEASEQSSGTTSYEPHSLSNVITTDKLARNALIREIASEFSDLFSIAREIPSPGVMYGTVTSSSRVEKEGTTTHVPAYSTYEYEVFDLGMIGVDELQAEQSPDIDIKTRSVSLKDFTTRVGRLKSITLFDDSDRKISETINHYLHDDVVKSASVEDHFSDNVNQYEGNLLLDFGNQGVVEETFADARYVKNKDGDEVLLGVISKKERFPSIFIGQTNINHRTGISTSSRTLAYDYYSGQPSLLYDINSYGDKIVTKTLPAYRLKLESGGYAYPEMGPISSSAMTNSNMIAQGGASFTFKMNDSFDPDSDSLGDSSIAGLLGASIQIWDDDEIALSPGNGITVSGDQTGIFREKSNYNFIGINAPEPDGSYVINYEDLVSSIQLVDNTPDLAVGWQQNNEITLYDVYSHALEVRDINGNYASTKMDLAQERVYSSVTNAEYSEFAYSGAEDGDGEGAGTNNFGGGVKQPDGERVHIFGDDGDENTADDKKAHTGFWSIETSTGTAFEYNDYLRSGQRYRVLAWCSESGGLKFQTIINGSALADVETEVLGSSNGWYLHEAVFDIAEHTDDLLDVYVYVVGVGGATKFIDDFRLHPADASMTAYVYNEWGELSDVLDQNNLYTHYQYNAMGQLKSVTKETFGHGPVKVSETIINYARSNN